MAKKSGKAVKGAVKSAAKGSVKSGMRKGLTAYGDEGFSLFLRKAFIQGNGLHR